jgi:undecaprenyl-diphosphatase
LDSVNLKQALIIGLFQCLALIPGTSRSGITITAGLFLGLSATAASRFSFLLAIPTIGAIALAELIRVSFIDIMDNGVELSIALIISFLVAYISIDMFLKLIDRIGFTPFVIYRLLLGGWLLMYWT